MAIYSDDTYPEDEATLEANYLNEMVALDELQAAQVFVSKLVNYWDKVFDEQSDLTRFINKFNSLVPPLYHISR